MLSPVLFMLVMIDLHAQTFVYTDNNTVGPNSVTAFSVAGNGALTNIGSFATGGSGSGGGLFAANRARTCMVGNRLYVANDGSRNVTGFDINPFTGSLNIVPGSPFPTGGAAGNLGISLDCTPNGGFLIAANSATQNITVFSIAANGALTPVAGSPFFTFGLTPNGIKVAPNGQFLAVALGNIDAVGLYSIASNGTLTPVQGSPFASPADGNVAGVDINCASTFLYAAQANLGGTNIDVFSISPNGALTLVQTSNNPGVGSNSNVGVLSPNDQFLFVSNQFSSSVTAFKVAVDGTLSLVAGSPFFGAGGDPSGVATNAAGTFLFAANYDNSSVTSFGVAADGTLNPVGSFATGQGTFTGLESLAIFPGKSCLVHDVCLQDDSNPNIVFLGNSQTGAYKFCCGGTVFTGVAQVTIRGKIITFQDNSPDRKVLATDDESVHVGKASLQSPPGSIKCTITDRNTANNSCACQ